MKRIYLDYAAATPVDTRVLKEMYRVEREVFANASALHHDGVIARSVLEGARERVANAIGAHSDEVTFSASGTESNNLALFGLAKVAQIERKRTHVVISAIEHPSVLECAAQLKAYGFSVDVLPVDRGGIIDMEALKKLLRPETLFVSVMYANNEIGTVEPLRDVMKLVRKFRKTNGSVFPYVHTDACQATNYLDMDVTHLGVDLMTFNSPKIYGPKGVAALYKKRGVVIEPVIYGGGQEQALRSGTEDTARIVGFARALEITNAVKESEVKRLKELQDFFVESVKKGVPNAVLNGSRTTRLPNNVNFSFPASPAGQVPKDAEEIVLRLDAKGIAASTRSACANQQNDSSASGAGSYVVRALGDLTYPFSSVRFTMGRATTKKEVEKTVRTLKEIVTKF